MAGGLSPDKCEDKGRLGARLNIDEFLKYAMDKLMREEGELSAKDTI